MEHNVATMAAWTAERGLLLAPHGKTTMAPALWRQLLDAGAWGITVATGWQAQVARSAGVPRVLLANELVDPVALGWVAGELDDPDFELCLLGGQRRRGGCDARWVDLARARAAAGAAASGDGRARWDGRTGRRADRG